MKNVYMYVLLFMLCCVKSFGQGSDVIFLVDNSGSIDNTEYNNMKTSIGSIMTQVLGCNPLNRIAVIQYSSVSGSAARIFIHSNFTSTAYTFNRQYNEVGNIPLQINTIANVLNGTSTAGVDASSTSMALTQNPANSLVVFIFTDAPRDNDLLSNSIVPGNNMAGFQAYTNFKNNFGAKFVVVNTETTANTIAASAGVASKGGSYTGSVEYYGNDPDLLPQPIPRMFINTSFLLTTAQINTVTDFICSVAEDPCAETLLLTHPLHDVITGEPDDNRRAEGTINASNWIYSGEVAIYHSETMIVLTDGFHSANSSRFRAYIAPCEDPFVGRPASTDRISAATGKSVQADEEALTQQLNTAFTLYPNPANSRVNLSATDGIKAVLVTSLDGKVMYNRNYSDTPTGTDLDISSYAQGYYMVSITTNKGEIQTQKLIKN